MKIAFITVGDPTRLTGGYLYHAKVFAMLRARGVLIDQIVASGAAQEEQVQQAGAFGVTFDPTPYDVVVVDALARTVCAPHLNIWRAMRPFIAMIHELPSVASNTQGDDAEAALLGADLLIAVSSHGAAILQARGVPPERIRIVSPGRDRVRGGKPGTGDEESIGTTRWTTTLHRPLSSVLCVAQWIPRKGIHTLVEAWRLRRSKAAQLVLIGELDADPEYTAIVHATIGTDQSIVVRGPIDDAALIAAYNAADIFALPSRYEGYGMVFAEALGYSLPIVACAVGPLPELLADAALLVPPDNPAALAAALDTLIENEALRATMAVRAGIRASALPTWADTAEAFERAVREACRSQ